MKYLKSFGLFETKARIMPSGLTARQENFLNANIYDSPIPMRSTKGGSWTIDPNTGLVDVIGNVYIKVDKFYWTPPSPNEKSPKPYCGIKFGKIKGDFSAGGGLSSLEGSPHTVTGDFSCAWNNLRTLEGAPRTVGGNFNCTGNKLISLEGGPERVGGQYICKGNPRETFATGMATLPSFSVELSSLAGAPLIIEGRKGLHLYGTCFESGYLEISSWDIKGWMKAFVDATPGYPGLLSIQRSLLLTLPQFVESPELINWFNSELSKDPEDTIIMLTSCWKDLPEVVKSKIVIPSEYKDEFETLSGLDTVGLL